tara:strand:- start:17711 stop:18052 length:342 start_codon:yes stop_codon:yes gene_type:complete
LAHTVTLLADHKGQTRPRVSGDEYFVDAAIVVTTYTAGGEVVSASSLGLGELTSVTITGNSLPATYSASAECTAAGLYEGGFHLYLVNMDGTNAQASGDITDTTIRIRAYGNI